MVKPVKVFTAEKVKKPPRGTGRKSGNKEEGNVMKKFMRLS
jgi:hypothetical protein